MAAETFIGLGAAGNFPNHLQQIGGEAEYASVVTPSAQAPKGLFPWYVQNAAGHLGINPVTHDTLRVPAEGNIQPEPELALDCRLVYGDGGQVVRIEPLAFGIINDASVRGSDRTVAEKKNWGADSKGLGREFVPIDSFEEGGVLDSYKIASWLRRDDTWTQYSGPSRVTDYSYFYGQLVEWLGDRFNNQRQEGPLDDLQEALATAGYPERAIIGVGATRYTEFGETHYLTDGDEYVVALYDGNQFRDDTLLAELDRTSFASRAGCLTLRQQVLVDPAIQL